MATISYVRICGTPIMNAIRELEKLTIKIPETCIINIILTNAPELNTYLNDPGAIAEYFSAIPIDVKENRN